MSRQPVVEIQDSFIDRMLLVLSVSGLAACWLLVIIYYERLPGIIPVHFRFNGEPDRYGSKIFIFSLPLIATVIFIFLRWIKKIPHQFNYPVKITPENAEWHYLYATRTISYLQTIITFIFTFIVIEVICITTMDSSPAFSWMFPIMIILLFAPLIYYFIKAKSEIKR